MNVKLNRRQLLKCSTITATGLAFSGTSPAVGPQGEGVQWHDVEDWGVEGKGWAADQCEKYFDRLPIRAKADVRAAVWNLSRHSAGMLSRFRTDADQIWVDYRVTSGKLAMPHMPATGVSGVDLYATDKAGQSRWVAVSRPTAQTVKTRLVGNLIPGNREYTAYLPLYNGTEYLRIGVPQGARFETIAPRTSEPIVFYGTSITHGACASRPGMPHPAILGRRLERPVINLGFSGNGKMEKEVGIYLCELDPSVYVIDCLPNMVGGEVAARAEPLVRQLRDARPETPILLVEDRTYANAGFVRGATQRHTDSRRALRAAYDRLVADGFKRLGYIEGETLLGNDREDTTDGSHPSDLGFYRHANAMESELRRLGA
ncbi:SGNH/GDSL hydrolase family protein [Rubripirellula sp.]|nr:SGNH/GDSL hydrolase family protein [Rubripirellula sp.]MDB4624878.1 SGNH/GDSL hydrolase family protein [Rubripirellula sp.]